MAHTHTSLTYHAIFSTKNRDATIKEEFHDRLFAYIGGIFDKFGGKLIRAGGTADHVHLLFQLDTTKSFAEVMRAIKANSSKWIHETFPDSGAFAWQSGYAAFTVSKSAMPDVTRYIENQQEHHRTQSFEDEFKAFLRRHEIEFDDRFVID
ncbi:MAG: IS200/IS605 family transposase [Planctomycetes bacterium]|nr:IS200/IS605 family transposase [Planctomycetota bacterium]